MVEDEVIAQQLEALLTLAITSQENYYRQLGLRDRILNLPFMVAVVLLKKGASINVSPQHRGLDIKTFFPGYFFKKHFIFL